jgi:hypothetical protein
MADKLAGPTNSRSEPRPGHGYVQMRKESVEKRCLGPFDRECTPTAKATIYQHRKLADRVELNEMWIARISHRQPRPGVVS